MTEIGKTLREARISRQLDITEIEEATKIRAKYLRAIENEEWNVLPGSTYTKSFIRAYSQYLELDPIPLIDNYRIQFEGYAEPELKSIRRRQREVSRASERGARKKLGTGPLLGILLAGLALVLLILGLTGGSEQSTTTAPDPNSGAEQRSRVTEFSLIPQANLWVCVVDATGKRVINRRIKRGDRVKTFRSKRFKVRLSNGRVTLAVNGRRIAVPNDRVRPSYLIKNGKASPISSRKNSDIKRCR